MAPVWKVAFPWDGEEDAAVDGLELEGVALGTSALMLVEATALGAAAVSSLRAVGALKPACGVVWPETGQCSFAATSDVQRKYSRSL